MSFDERGVAAAIRRAGSSTAQGPDVLAVLDLYHLGERDMAFLTELFKLSVAEVDIPVGDFEGREATRPGSLLPPHLTALPGSEDIGAAPPLIHRGGTGYTPLPAWLQTEALHRLGPAPNFCYRVDSGFNQRKPPGRIVVDNSKALDTVFHRLLIEMIHRS